MAGKCVSYIAHMRMKACKSRPQGSRLGTDPWVILRLLQETQTRLRALLLAGAQPTRCYMDSVATKDCISSYLCRIMAISHSDLVIA